MQIAPTYYAAKVPAAVRPAIRDAELIPESPRARITTQTAGARKVHAELNRRGISGGWCMVERLTRIDASVELCGRRIRGAARRRLLKPSVLRIW